MSKISAASEKWMGWKYSDEFELPNVVRGEGIHAYADDGSAYIDACGGPTLFSLGYNHAEVCAAIQKQLSEIQYGFTAFFRTDAIDGLAERIVESAGGGLERVSFLSGGSEAVEQAMKIALQYHVARGCPGRTHFISRRRSWHGSTLGGMSLSGFTSRRRGLEHSLIPNVSFLSPVNTYRPPKGVAPENVAEYCADELEREILRLGPGQVAAFIFEPVVGAAGCVVPAPEGYAKRVREICDRYEVLMIADEVMCGVGRTGTWRALEHDGAEPDIMTVAKGVGGGFIPLGATLFKKSIHDPVVDCFGEAGFLHTASGHSLACAAGLAILNIIERDNLVRKCADDGAYLLRRLREEVGDHPHVGDIRGRGLFIGVEFVEDRATKEPFAPNRQISEEVFNRGSQENGLFVYPTSGIVDGIHGDGVIISPAYIVTRDEIEEIVARFKSAVVSLFEA